MKLVPDNIPWSRYCAGSGGTGGASAGRWTVREPPLLLKLQLRSSTAAASSRSSCPVAFLPDDVGLWSWLSCRKCPKPETLGTLPAAELAYGAVWYDRDNMFPLLYLLPKLR